MTNNQKSESPKQSDLHHCGRITEMDKTAEDSHDMVEEIKKLLNCSRTGLRNSSNTNKTRYSILALVDDVAKKAWKEGYDSGEESGAKNFQVEFDNS